MIITTIIILISLGFVSGLFAGLLGIGGGIIFLPFAKLYFLDYLHYDHDFIKILIATSTAIIVINTFTSVYNHKKSGNVIFSFWPYFLVATILGSQIGGLLIKSIPAIYLEITIAVLLFLAALKMIFVKQTDNPPKEVTKKEYYTIAVFAFIISLLTTILGVGAGSKMVVLLYIIVKLPLNKTIGTTSLFTFFVSITAAFFYLTHATDIKTPDSHTLIGYIDITVFLYVSIGGMIGAKLGVILVNVIPKSITKKIFIAFLLFGATKMVF